MTTTAPSLGTVDVACPVCGQQLHVPILLASMTDVWCVTADPDFLSTHWLTHHQHDGEPLPVAA